MDLLSRARQRADISRSQPLQGRSSKQSRIITELEQALSDSSDWKSHLTSSIMNLNWDHSTLLKYDRWVRLFISQTGISLPDSGILDSMLIDFVVGLVASGNLSGALQAISALAHFWKLNLGVDVWKSPRIRAFHGGLLKVKQLLQPPESKRDPLPISALLRWISVPSSKFSHYEILLTATVMSIGIRCIRRAGELADLNEDHLSVSNHGGVLGASILVSHSKTDTIGRGHVIEIEPRTSLACPILLLDRYLHLKGSSLSQWKGRKGVPLFTTLKGSRLSSRAIKSMVRAVASHASLPGKFGSHSIRITGACMAILGGMTLEQVMAIGAWKSRAIEIYLRSLVAVAMGASFRMGL